MRALKFITGHVINNPAYTYKFQLKTTIVLEDHCESSQPWSAYFNKRKCGFYFKLQVHFWKPVCRKAEN